MALLNDIELSNGLKVEKAYIRISYFSGTESRVDFNADAYISEGAFNEGKTPISTFSYSMEFDKDRNLFSQMYEHLRSLPEYKNAIDA